MSDDDASLTITTREWVVTGLDLENFDRTATAAERRWVRDGWIPASLKLEVRDD